MRWVRIWTKETVTGSTFQELDAETRGVWFSLLPLAGMNDPEGYISAFQGTVPMTEAQMSEILHIDKEVIRRAIKRLEEVKKIELLPTGIIRIVKWTHYQGYDNEYQRQKYYRNAPKVTDVVTGMVTKVTGQVTRKVQDTSISISKSNSRGFLGGEQIRNAFDKFWAVYPNPILKNQSFKSFVANVRTLEEMDSVVVAAKNYAHQCEVRRTDPKFVKYPSSWLKDWRDWVEVEKPKAKGPRRENKPELEAILARGRASRRTDDGGVGDRGTGTRGGPAAGAGS